MNKKRITLIAFHFSPDPAIGSVRPENWAHWLSEEFEVTVVTRKATKPIQDISSRFKILRTNSILTDAIEKIAIWKRNRTIAKNRNKTKTEEKSKKSKSGAITYRMPCLYDVWFFSALRESLRTKPEIIIASHSPYVCLLVALTHKILQPKTKIILDFRDLWVENHTSTGLPIIRKIEKALEKMAVGKADAITTVSQGLANYFRINGHQGKTHVVYNSPTVNSVKNKNTVLMSNSRLKLLYTGTIYEKIFDPRPIFRLLTSLSESGAIKNGDVEFIFASRKPGDFLKIAETEGVRDFIRFVGELSRAECIEIQNKSDVLVLFEYEDSNAKGILTGKVFEYLATEKPILLIGSDDKSELRQLLKSHNRLITLSNLEDLLKGLAALPICERVDYSKISRNQLMTVMKNLYAS